MVAVEAAPDNLEKDKLEEGKVLMPVSYSLMEEAECLGDTSQGSHLKVDIQLEEEPYH
jgi:hypothetical protein